MHKPRAWRCCWRLCWDFYAAWRADVRLAESVQKHWEGRDVAFTGRVIGLPEQTANGLRFVLDLAQVDTPVVLLPGRVQLGWMRCGRGEPLPELAGGDLIDLQARLYRPHGSVNSGGFDYEAWLLERGMAPPAT